mmetsp:Transcript_19658/g.28897  ORF Transcript_19658/g.28897 Transcript_19658/m.28897 type:complete len:449 (-) Transcript_19658:331-1677(-)|eukprot:CAMPEP_0195519166 /NCGR_PEP_ID=MMETSP0794_2-20130614/14490_1 /TAXON_ID=515487 /ORGANISM="Stephanopyxis turris, Strain CCMP 815" /LENGTH=448 /DNA_ID=CAMNT_0040648277 /DNA_START=78 /DNA_END=1424 /DNA_ORIENTATION=+
MGWRSKVHTARKLHRPSLKNWECDGLHETFPEYVQSITGENAKKCESFTPFEDNSQATLPDCDIPLVAETLDLPVQDFIDKMERKSLPSIIRGIPNANSWPAVEKWKLDTIASDPDLAERYFKVGEDDDGKSVKLKLRHFMRYTRDTKDDSPLYIFDSAFDEDRVAKKLLDHYTVPSYFNEDLFHLVGERRRPPYRWFLVGPKRSGTTVHIDPLGTSAWNTLISGKKRWVLFPPGTARGIVKGRGLIRKHEDDEAIHYFTTILPRIKKRALEERDLVGKDRHDSDWNNFKCYEFTQTAGETVFIPNGWWHAVLNLTDTVGITQNFCSSRNFDEVWVQTRRGRKKMAWKWLCHLDREHPRLANRARSLNKTDEFAMRYDPAQVRKRKRAEERRKRGRKEAKMRRKESTKRHSDSNRDNVQSKIPITDQSSITSGGESEGRAKKSRTVSP